MFPVCFHWLLFPVWYSFDFLSRVVDVGFILFPPRSNSIMIYLRVDCLIVCGVLWWTFCPSSAQHPRSRERYPPESLPALISEENGLIGAGGETGYNINEPSYQISPSAAVAMTAHSEERQQQRPVAALRRTTRRRHPHRKPALFLGDYDVIEVIQVQLHHQKRNSANFTILNLSLINFVLTKSQTSKPHSPQSTVHSPIHSPIYSPQSTVHGPQSTVHSPQSSPQSNLQSTVHSPQSNLQSTVHSPQSTVHSPRSIVHSPWSMVHGPQSIVHIIRKFFKYTYIQFVTVESWNSLQVVQCWTYQSWLFD